MRNIKISTRLFVGFLLLIFLLLCMSAIGAWRIVSAKHANEAVQHSQLISSTIMHWARNVQVNGERAQAVPNMNNKNAVDIFQKRMRDTSAQIDQFQNSVDELLQNPQARQLFENVLAARKAYTGPRAVALQDLKDGNEAKANNFFQNEMPGLIANYLGAIDKVYDFQINRQNNLYKENHDDNELGLWILGIATLISIILGPFISWYISSSIINPLDEAVDLAATVAKQDLTVSIVPRGNDEITKLQQSLGDMVNNLRSAVGNVLMGADTIALAAKEISDGNLDLSSRTEQQASSLAETAASMEEITATVRQSADNAQQANILSKDASDTAVDGGEMVSGLVNTMSEINTKAQQIADIVGVIDSIAFQTNILALNAAVEAARAGEQGRGFAVVAAEVRALAQRSAASAKDISELINDSVMVIGQGNEQASLTGRRMQDLVNDITKVTDIVAEINSATKEQTIGIEQINTAITQMDDVTRQNASLVQESSAAANSLQEQADALAELVAGFRLSERQINHQYSGSQQLSHAGSTVKMLV